MIITVGIYVHDKVELLIQIDASARWSRSFGYFGKSNRNDFSPVPSDY